MSQNDSGNHVVIISVNTNSGGEVGVNHRGPRSPRMMSPQQSVTILWPEHIAFILTNVQFIASIGTTDRFHSICPDGLQEHLNCFMN